MDQEIKKSWVAALRSGNYAQGKFGLRTGDKFCCLGVLCDTIDPKAWVPFEHNTIYNWHGRGGTLIDSVTEGLVGGLGFSAQCDLIHMNDPNDYEAPNPKSFVEIADWIEENL